MTGQGSCFRYARVFLSIGSDFPLPPGVLQLRQEDLFELLRDADSQVGVYAVALLFRLLEGQAITSKASSPTKYERDRLDASAMSGQADTSNDTVGSETPMPKPTTP